MPDRDQRFNSCTHIYFGLKSKKSTAQPEKKFQPIPTLKLLFALSLCFVTAARAGSILKVDDRDPRPVIRNMHITAYPDTFNPTDFIIFLPNNKTAKSKKGYYILITKIVSPACPVSLLQEILIKDPSPPHSPFFVDG